MWKNIGICQCDLLFALSTVLKVRGIQWVATASVRTLSLTRCGSWGHMPSRLSMPVAVVSFPARMVVWMASCVSLRFQCAVERYSGQLSRSLADGAQI